MKFADFILRRVAVGRYSVRLREQPWLLIGEALRVVVGPDAGTWKALVWDDFLGRFTAESAATFTCRWEAVGFLSRYRALAKETA